MPVYALLFSIFFWGLVQKKKKILDIINLFYLFVLLKNYQLYYLESHHFYHWLDHNNRGPSFLVLCPVQVFKEWDLYECVPQTTIYFTINSLI